MKKTVFKGELAALKTLQKAFTREQKAIARANATLPHQATTGTPTLLNAEDKALLRQALKGVSPLRHSQRAERQPTVLRHPEYFAAKRQQAEGQEKAIASPHPSPKRSKAPTAQTRTTEEGQYLAPGLGTDVLKKLRQFYWPIQATLDLHGYTSEQASERFDRFIQACVAHGLRAVLIIHGKGQRSKDKQAVLKPQVMAWLRHLPQVQAYIPAPDNAGGQGALVVLLRA